MSASRHARLLAAGCVFLFLSMTTSGLSAQEGCEFVDPTRSANVRGEITYFGGPHFLCGGNTEIWADTAVHYQSTETIYLWGSVRFSDQGRELSADSAAYTSRLGRLEAYRDVYVVNDEDGSIIENGDLLLLRATDARAEDELTVTIGSDGQRPRALVFPQAAADEATTETEPSEPQPYTIEGERIHFVGDAYFTSVGDVEIVRDSLFAFADSAEYDAREGDAILVLEGSARVRSASYDLEGRTITVATTDAGEEIRAVRDAHLVGEDLTVTSPMILLFLTEGALERLVAVPVTGSGPGNGDAAPERLSAGDVIRPFAVGEAFELTGDSLDMVAPGGVVERILAAGMARSVSHERDSLNSEALPEVARSDWMEGDTIVITMRPAVQDTATSGGPTSSEEATSEYEIERIVARVGARSLYRLEPADSLNRTADGPPAVSYLLAEEITIHMDGGRAQRVESRGGVRGIHLEPLRPADAPADSTDVPPDSTQAPAGDGSLDRDTIPGTRQ